MCLIVNTTLESYVSKLTNQIWFQRTALHWAASYGNLEHMRVLIKQDSNSGIPDSDGKTPLHWAASSHDGVYQLAAVRANFSSHKAVTFCLP